MPHLNELFKKYDRKDLVILGVHTKNAAEKMPAFVKSSGILYPVAVDTKGKTVEAFRVDSFPDYYLIDRAGKLRFADLANAELDRAISLLVKEKAPEKLDALKVHKAARARALAEKKNLLIHLGAPW